MNTNRFNQGFGLIEVLVAVLVLSIGMLGVAGTLLAVSRSASSSYARQQAITRAYDIVDRMRANAATANNPTSSNPYIAALTPPSGAPSPDCTASACTAQQMAAFDLWQWKTSLQTSLPSGLGSVAISQGTNSTTTITVNISWNDQPAQATFAGTKTTSPANATYTIVTAL
ncbi:type IV pilus modification protein PilV [Dyella japonica]|uniref:Type IV pilus assembly protein PilV n=1 Tax=Dyella japonica TaxID=231455 RepID=A0ABV2K159_9GAMM